MNLMPSHSQNIICLLFLLLTHHLSIVHAYYLLFIAMLEVNNEREDRCTILKESEVDRGGLLFAIISRLSASFRKKIQRDKLQRA
jgi:hypothetical protein